MQRGRRYQFYGNFYISHGNSTELMEFSPVPTIRYRTYIFAFIPLYRRVVVAQLEMFFFYHGYSMYYSIMYNGIIYYITFKHERKTIL